MNLSTYKARKYTEHAEKNSHARALVDKIADKTIAQPDYKRTMIELGQALAESFVSKIDKESHDDLYVICTVEDADYLARGVIERLESFGFTERIKLMCMWNAKVREEGISLSPVARQYFEPKTSDRTTFIVVKSIISSACVVKTNITRAISTMNPDDIFVVSPVLQEGAQVRLEKEFPSEMSGKFRYYWFATDSEKQGDDVVPGIGGQIYERLGLGNEIEKNKITPEIVKSRRKLRNNFAVAV